MAAGTCDFVRGLALGRLCSVALKLVLLVEITVGSHRWNRNAHETGENSLRAFDVLACTTNSP